MSSVALLMLRVDLATRGEICLEWSGILRVYPACGKICKHMASQLYLPDGRAALLLTPRLLNWFEVEYVRYTRSTEFDVEFLTPDWRVLLGADDRAVIRKRLLTALQPPRPTETTWVLSLTEGHGSIYAKAKGERLALYVQNAEATPIGCLHLDATRSGQWVVNLRDWR